MWKNIVVVCTALLCLASAHATDTRKIVFVDTGNTGRSVSAEAIANALIAKDGLPIAVISRAVDLNPFFVHPEANVVTILQARGIDVRSHLAAQITVNDVRHADLILTMTAKHKDRLLEMFPEARQKIYTLTEYATGTSQEIADAYGQSMEFYENMFRQLDTYVPLALEKALKSTP